MCLALAAALTAAACGGASTAPTPPDPGAPTLSCPAPPDSVQAVDASGAIVIFGAASASGGAPPLTGPTCSATSGSKFQVGTTTVICTVTDSKSRPATCSFSVVVTPAPVVPRIIVTNLLAFGDSITWGEDGRTSNNVPLSLRQFMPAVQFPVQNTYPGALETLLLTRYKNQTPRVWNLGQKGELAGVSATFSRFVSQTSSGKYDALLLMEGANDVGDRDAAVFPEVIFNLRRMIRDAQSRNMKAMLATISPQVPPTLTAFTVDGLNAQIRQLAVDERVPLVDVFQALNTNTAAYIGPDGLHPTADGYHKIADTFFTSIKANWETTPTTTSTAAGNRFLPAPRR